MTHALKTIDTARLFRPELFLPDLAVASKDELFATLVDALVEHGVAQHRDALLTGLLERERLGSTAVGCGVAVPHARSMVVGSTAAVVARLRDGIDFAAADGRPVQLVLLIVAPYGAPGSLFSPLVAAIARSVADQTIRARLAQAATFADFEKLMRPLIRTPLMETRTR